MSDVSWRIDEGGEDTCRSASNFFHGHYKISTSPQLGTLNPHILVNKPSKTCGHIQVSEVQLQLRTYMRQRREVSGFYKPRFGLAKSWAISTGRALAYLHGLKHPIIHRDMKPLNLFLGRNLEARSTQSCTADFLPELRKSIYNKIQS